jgi:hypothetical protein
MSARSRRIEIATRKPAVSINKITVGPNSSYEINAVIEVLLRSEPIK